MNRRLIIEGSDYALADVNAYGFRYELISSLT